MAVVDKRLELACGAQLWRNDDLAAGDIETGPPFVWMTGILFCAGLRDQEGEKQKTCGEGDGKKAEGTHDRANQDGDETDEGG